MKPTGAKMIFRGIIAGLIVMAVQACSKTPVACFNTTPPLDSIHVNQVVTFNATCSFSADSYNWQFYNNADSTAFTPVVSKVFKDTGTVNVYLLVTSGSNDAGVNTNITVLP